MKLAINSNPSENHLKYIVDALDSSSEAHFAVAFFKRSGLRLIKKPITKFLKNGGQITVIVGQNFALTEPEALYELRTILKPYPNSRFYLAKASSNTRVFHPKLYMFSSRKRCSVISGSANITKGGLLDNKEASLIVSCSKEDKLWKQGMQYFEDITNINNADPISLLVIKQYETFYKEQKRFNKGARSNPRRTNAQHNFVENLHKYFEEFDNEYRLQNYKLKVEDYKLATKVLDEIADRSKLRQSDFEPLLDRLVGSKGNERLWHSGSLFRLRKKVYPYFKEFRELVRFIRANKDKDLAFLFDEAKKKVQKIEGAGENYVSEILMTYNSKICANINNNPLTVLRKAGDINIKSTSSSYRGSDYKDYCEIITEINSQLGLKDMLEADSYFNHIYWKIYK